MSWVLLLSVLSSSSVFIQYKSSVVIHSVLHEPGLCRENKWMNFTRKVSLILSMYGIILLYSFLVYLFFETSSCTPTWHLRLLRLNDWMNGSLSVLSQSWLSCCFIGKTWRSLFSILVLVLVFILSLVFVIKGVTSVFFDEDLLQIEIARVYPEISLLFSWSDHFFGASYYCVEPAQKPTTWRF